MISGGFGLFAAILPAGFSRWLSGTDQQPSERSLAHHSWPAICPGNAWYARAAVAAGATAFTTGFNNGANFNALNSAVTAATGTPFSAPNFFDAASGQHPPRFQEWNLQVERDSATTRFEP